MLKFYPAPNVEGTADGCQNYLDVQVLPTIAQGNITTQKNFSAVLDDVFVFSASLGSNITRLANPVGLAFPIVSIDDGAYNQLSESEGNPATRAYQSYQGTVTKMAGNHSFRFGTDLRMYRESTGGYGSVAPRFDFGKGWTRGPLDNSAVAPLGQVLASMLLGLPTGGMVNVNSSAAEQSSFFGLFFQDDWKVSSKLTVNGGIRWEYDSAITERYNRSLRSFDFSTANPISAQALVNYGRSPIPGLPTSQFRTPGGLTFAGVGGEPSASPTSSIPRPSSAPATASFTFSPVPTVMASTRAASIRPPTSSPRTTTAKPSGPTSPTPFPTASRPPLAPPKLSALSSAAASAASAITARSATSSAGHFPSNARSPGAVHLSGQGPNHHQIPHAASSQPLRRSTGICRHRPRQRPHRPQPTPPALSPTSATSPTISPPA